MCLLQADKLKAALLQYKQQQSAVSPKKKLSASYACQKTPKVRNDDSVNSSHSAGAKRSFVKSTPRFVSSSKSVEKKVNWSKLLFNCCVPVHIPHHRCNKYFLL